MHEVRAAQSGGPRNATHPALRAPLAVTEQGRGKGDMVPTKKLREGEAGMIISSQA